MKNSILKITLLVGTLVCGLNVHAEEAADKNKGVETQKQEMLQHLDTRISALQNAKTCISAAQDHESLKKCHSSLQDERMGMREEMMAKRQKHMEERKARQEERKARRTGK